ncbi:hypothetical protein ACLB1M_01560 [Escherichia coli]
MDALDGIQVPEVNDQDGNGRADDLMRQWHRPRQQWKPRKQRTRLRRTSWQS